MPYTIGLIFLLLFLAGLSYKDPYIFVGASILSFVFYPPIIVFLLPAYVIYYIKNTPQLILISCLTLIPIIFSDFVQSKIFRLNLEGGMQSFPIWYVVPIISIPFILIGLYKLYMDNKIFLLSPVFVGLFYWILYTLYPHVIVIEYPRIVIITSILLVTFSGIGINTLNQELSKKYIMTGIFTIFIIINLFYPTGNNWKNFKLYPFSEVPSQPILSSPPMLRYLTLEDLEIFRGINENRIITPSRKGLVLGVATSNRPLESKNSTITVNTVSYDKFMGLNCSDKFKLTKEYKVTYIYSHIINCDNFELIDKSEEGLYLYLVNKSR